jgi:hypothetical protein
MPRKKSSATGNNTRPSIHPLAPEVASTITCPPANRRHAFSHKGSDADQLPNCLRCGGVNPRWNRELCAVQTKQGPCKRTEAKHKAIKSHSFDNEPSSVAVS